MFAVTVKSDVDRFKASLNSFARTQLPFAVSRALNDSSASALDHLQRDLPRIFDDPTPFTRHGFFRRPARKDHLATSVEIKYGAGKGTPAEKFLAPEISGGARNIKRFERAISYNALLPTGALATVPGRGAKLDRYGNVSSGTIVQMLSHLRVLDRSGSQGNVSAATLDRLRKRKRLTKQNGLETSFFIARSKSSGRPLGVWRLMGPGQVAPFLLFTREPPHYRPRFEFSAILIKAFDVVFPFQLPERLREAIATARR